MHFRVLGPTKCQNLELNFKEFCNDDNRHFSLNHIKRQLANGTVVDRDWVVFSPSQKAVLCFVCKLFGTTKQNNEMFANIGFKDWKNCNRTLTLHENSKQHITNYLTYRTRAKQTNTLDANILKQEQIEMQYWRQVLHRVATVVKFLAGRGLAFRGSDQIFGSNSNGNYLGVIELLSKYDSFLANHIATYGNKGKGKFNIEWLSILNNNRHMFV
jgi:hypothetical protein